MEAIKHITVSVIIPTYNRKGELEKLLRSLDRQTLSPSSYEIIVIDDGSEDGTGEWLLEYKEQCAVSLSLYTQVRGGPGTARNTGMEKAAGEIFAFTDTDCIVQPEWLEHLIEPFSAEQVGAVGGSEIINDHDPLLMRCFHYLMTAPLATGGLRGKKGKRLARFYPRTFNMAISRKAYQVTGGFKKMFHAEDIELSYRIKQAGFALTYQDSAQVYHRRRSTVTQFVQQLFHMGKARVTLARLHPSSLEPLHILPALALALSLLLALLAVSWHPALSLFLAYLVLGLLFLVMLGITSTMKLRSLKAFFLIPLLFILQQSAYGFGFFTSLLRRT